ncbi:Arginine transport system permease protein ArtQ [Blastochloris viridis]|uniref:Arginine transport system permease protein ArtQ n=1 Tax=Blastochloris viridis TaxID=1079 RepID=A0A0S4Q4P0_BLAVI|nr:Arginine transport system permease protein ArtQ [Blastochloris viridis]
MVLGIVITTLRLERGPPRWLAIAIIELFRNTPLLVQLLFWYFAAFALLPRGWKMWIAADHAWAVVPPGVPLIAPEFLVATWGLALFTAVFLAEELRTGLAAVPAGQIEAARAQGLGRLDVLRFILLPQAVANAWQPMVGQLLNLMKLSSLASSIGLAEITYQARTIESYNAHSVEAFAAGTLLYLAIGLIMSRILVWLGPHRPGSLRRSSAEARLAATGGGAL